jgi:hypothetical protein
MKQRLIVCKWKLLPNCSGKDWKLNTSFINQPETLLFQAQRPKYLSLLSYAREILLILINDAFFFGETGFGPYH